jgi:hypothetical protein
MRTFDSKRLGNRESNPGRRSGYERNLISELQINSILQKKANALSIHKPSQTTRTGTPD